MSANAWRCTYPNCSLRQSAILHVCICGPGHETSLTCHPFQVKPCDPSPAFWLVWHDGYNSTPHFKHDTEGAARAEAKRLAEANPGAAFYVLPATTYAICEVSPVRFAVGPVPPLSIESEEVPF